MIKIQNRIELIDGFRGIAILSVMAYHYYARFAPPVYPTNLYPFEPLDLPPLRYGYYGVNLFFVVSGFVIFQSLGKSDRPSEFFKNRCARLVPSMILCSLLTYLFVAYADSQNEFIFFHSTTPLNFLPSVTFTPVIFWNFLFDRTDIGYVDGAYWSLWAEVFFYGVAGALYYMKRASFLNRWLIITTLLQLVRAIPEPVLSWLIPFDNIVVEKLYYFFFVFNIHYWVYFSLGIFAFSLHAKQPISTLDSILMIVLIVGEFYSLNFPWLKASFLLIILLFYLFLRKPNWLNLLKSPILVRIGVISYPLYLLHQNVGVILISKISRWVGHPALNVLVPLVVAALITGLCYAIYLFYERPVIRYFRFSKQL